MRTRLNVLRVLIAEALRNAYEVLGLSPQASDEEIARAWQKLAIKNHPDRNRDDPTGAHARLATLNMAKDHLLNNPKQKDRQSRAFNPMFTDFNPRAAKPDEKEAPKAGPAAPPPAPKAPETKLHKCPWCERSVAGQPRTMMGITEDVFVNHYISRDSGMGVSEMMNRCPGSGKWISAKPRIWTCPVCRRKLASTMEGAAKPIFPRHMTSVDGQQRCPGSSKRVEDDPQPTRGPTGPVPRGAPPPPADNDGYPEANPRRSAYKVYPWRQGRRVVRVNGKLYGTDTGGRLKDGGTTKFNANDKARVQRAGGRLKVSKTDSDHSQTWDPIDEIRQVVDELVIDELARARR